MAYYQQVGRAGRGLASAYGILLSGQEDDDINDFFIESAFPTNEEVSAVLAALDRAPKGLSVPELLAEMNINKGRVEKTIQLLSLESPAPIAKQGTRWQLTAAELSTDFRTRAQRLTDIRRREQQEMREYVNLPSGHMEYLIRTLDGDPRTVQPPALPPLPADLDVALVREAVAFLRRIALPLQPRKQWPAGGMPHIGETGRIAAQERAEPGRALCVWGDAGWGALVRKGMYVDGHLDNDLVHACVELIAAWGPSPTPTWVTCLPSSRHPNLVPGFAQRLAAKLRAPFVPILEKTEDRPQQKTMANSTQQARNVDGAFRVTSAPAPGPVLLVDDLVHSGWTMTMAAWLLRRGGSGEVFPLALATTTTGSR